MPVITGEACFYIQMGDSTEVVRALAQERRVKLTDEKGGTVREALLKYIVKTLCIKEATGIPIIETGEIICGNCPFHCQYNRIMVPLAANSAIVKSVLPVESGVTV